MDLDVWHWTIILGVSFIMGIIRAVKNSSILNAVLSVFIPVDGFIYFFVAKRSMQT
jgi:hypothetical protein